VFIFATGITVKIMLLCGVAGNKIPLVSIPYVV
jgi:hypothetical protein